MELDLRTAVPKGARAALQQKDYDAQQKEIKALKADVSRLRNNEAAAATVRAKERALAELPELAKRKVRTPA